jgi:hypothetical protein
VSRSTTDLLLELILHDFSGRVQRKRVKEFDVSWRFEKPAIPVSAPDVTVSYDD